jgi:hypothetical protein
VKIDKDTGREVWKDPNGALRLMQLKKNPGAYPCISDTGVLGWQE